ncbi:MAG: bifunctional aldolase/short-chain dehydrogenase [Proteobacteria bacterium]|nr:bifunctional aldolase/short-chain dehydrogenase [Pseudomonadota bacterium]
MQSRWDDAEAQALIDHYGARSFSADLALRIYSTRLLGRDKRLVLHGGGNTSVKTRMHDLNGELVDVLCVKGSGADMAAIEPGGLPALRIAPLRRLRTRETLADADMVRIQRANLIDPAAPNPSVETLLHAFLPATYVDHTHASAILSVVDQVDGMARAEEIFAGRMGVVPYIMPGFALAKAAAAIFDAAPKVDGLILDKHGLFTFGATAREAYERMIAAVSLAEARIARARRRVFANAALPGNIASATALAPILRGACSRAYATREGAWQRPILELRTDAQIRHFVDGGRLRDFALRGVVTPDHAIRTKNWPLIVETPVAGGLNEYKPYARATVDAFVARYRSYFEHHNARVGGDRRMLDPMPRVVLVPGIGLYGLGPSKKDACIAADIAQAAIEAITGAEAIGRFQSISEADMFAMEYWPLEQAKLGAASARPLAGQVAAITGGAGAIGAATARAFCAAGAEVALIDIDLARAREVAAAVGGGAVAIAADVTDAPAVTRAFDAVVENFGGLDILVANAGAAWQGRIGEVEEKILRASFELNFFAHQRCAQAAVAIMRAQGTGGCLLFNVSKQAVNPGADFGPYGLPKAATLFLVRQYALDHGADKIRANGVNADRVRSRLMTPSFIAERARARGLGEADYMRANLLGYEVTADDVAQAFLHHALALKSSGDVTTVDGGNIAAALR